MVWDEIKRILMGTDDDNKRSHDRWRRASAEDEEVADELATGVTYADPQAAQNLGGGVSVEPTPVRQGEAFTIDYRGALAREGAAGVTLHCGYGAEHWSHIQDVPMHPIGYGKWQVTIFSDHSGPFGFCFRDTAGHWDNNGGRNWSINILPESR